MTVVQPVPRRMQVNNGALVIAIARGRTRWGPQDVLTAPTCVGCGRHRPGPSYVN
jgi:hypothetical protein